MKELTFENGEPRDADHDTDEDDEDEEDQEDQEDDA